jgi:glucose/arabinose dehydrogenase
LYVVEQAGVIRVVDGGSARDAPYLDITSKVRTSPKGAFASERGLLSIAFPPDHAKSGRFYVDYTDRNGGVNVVEYRAVAGRADPASARNILHVAKKSERHHGGQLQFGPDGRLYVSLGDDEESRVHPQSLEAGDLLGKILARDVGDTGAAWEVIAYGMRNPWRFSFDSGTGDLWVADVGEAVWEEVTRVPAGSGLVNPVIGGYVYRGRRLVRERGRYFYADYCAGSVWSVDPDRPQDVRLELELPTTIASFGQDSQGELYLVSRTGKIFRLAPG